jgi:NAD(P)H-nitrite reductase large subunit
MLSDGENGVIIQRDKQTYAVAPHIPCGLVTPDILRKIAEVAEKYQCEELKITSAARIALIGIKEEDVDAIWSDLGMDAGGVVGLCVRSVKACPGTQFCKRGQQDSLAVGLMLDEKYHGVEMPSKMKMGVSGCPNQCAETCIKDIGLVGTPKGWRLLAGGNGGPNPRLATLLAKDLITEDALGLIDKVVEYYRANAKPRERMGRMIERLGLENVQQALGFGPLSTQEKPPTRNAEPRRGEAGFA